MGMAKRISDNKHYRITLAERAEVETGVGKITLHPGREYTVRGDVLKALRDKVTDAKAV